MCGIFAVFGPGAKNSVINRTMANLIKHRGPDYTGEYISPDGLAHIIHHRLAIVHPQSGAQPIISDLKVLAVNGEIYNYRELNDEYKLGIDTTTSHSDCDVLIPLLDRFGSDHFSEIKINGMYALVYYDERINKIIVARDYMGIIPLYYAIATDGTLYISSEFKALVGLDIITTIKEFSPNSIWIVGERWCRFARSMESNFITPTVKQTYLNLKAAVASHIATEVPMAVLLSGGLDSSIIASMADDIIVKKHFHDVIHNGLESHAIKKIHTYSVGLKDSPDLKAARVMAQYLGSEHHEVLFTIEEAISFLPDAIRMLETYDITTIRAGLPMLLMMKQIKLDGFKVVLSGEGSDEEWAGYVYNRYAPGHIDLLNECSRKMDDLHWYDCRRANMAGAAYGIEVRVPFLDRSVVDYVMQIDPRLKMHNSEFKNIEKRHLREACEGILPAEIAWRGKEQFSDGVGYQWIDTLKRLAETRISDADFINAARRFPTNTPLTKEGYWYRNIFEHHFQSKPVLCCPNQKSVACCSPTALKWKEDWVTKNDPSGRI